MNETSKTKPLAAPAPAAFSVGHWLRENRARAFQGYLVVAIIGFVVLLVFASGTPYFSLDLTIERFVQSARSVPMDTFMEAVSFPGFAPQSFILTAIVVIALFLIGWRWEAGMLLFAALGATLLGVVVKFVVHRARPTADLVNVFQQITGYSFPSGHVLYYTAFFGFLWFLVYTLLPHSWWRTLGLFFFGGLVALVGLSRVYLGQHWPSDVLGAYLLGSLWLALTIFIYRKYKTRTGETPLQTVPTASEAGAAQKG